MPPPSPVGEQDDPFYVRQLAENEARLLTAVAETSGAIRGEENRGTLEQLVRDIELNRQPDTAPIANLL